MAQKPNRAKPWQPEKVGPKHPDPPGKAREDAGAPRPGARARSWRGG